MASGPSRLRSRSSRSLRRRGDRLLRRMGVSYQEEKDEYEREVDKAVARDGGTMVLNLTPSWGIGLVSPYNVQDGFYPGRGT